MLEFRSGRAIAWPAGSRCSCRLVGAGCCLDPALMEHDEASEEYEAWRDLQDVLKERDAKW
jgi:hypothetical protein